MGGKNGIPSNEACGYRGTQKNSIGRRFKWVWVQKASLMDLGWVLDELPSKPNKITPTHTSTPSLDLAVLEEQEVLHGDLKRRDEFDSVERLKLLVSSTEASSLAASLWSELGREELSSSSRKEEMSAELGKQGSDRRIRRPDN
nr:hypothetical protein Iba_chr13fCG9160 [Ipomoea batatas]